MRRRDGGEGGRKNERKKKVMWVDEGRKEERGKKREKNTVNGCLGEYNINIIHNSDS